LLQKLQQINQNGCKWSFKNIVVLLNIVVVSLGAMNARNELKRLANLEHPWLDIGYLCWDHHKCSKLSWFCHVSWLSFLHSLFFLFWYIVWTS
jgi:hypothetical protein